MIHSPIFFLLQVLICRNEAEKCLIETSINSLRISMKVVTKGWLDVIMLVRIMSLNHLSSGIPSYACFFLDRLSRQMNLKIFSQRNFLGFYQ